MIVDYYGALESGTKVLENKEAVLLYMENGWWDGQNFDFDKRQVVEPGEYLAIEKKAGWNAWIGCVEVRKSTKGNFKRCKKAFEKYSPNEMAKLYKEAGVIPA